MSHWSHHRGAPQRTGRPAFFWALFFLALSLPHVTAAAAERDFSLQGVEREYTLSAFRGKPLILYFMTFKCPHCRNLEPLTKAMAADGKNYAFLGVVFGTPLADIPRLRRERQIDYPLARGNKEVLRDYQVNGVPYFWVLDSAGRPKERFFGEPGAEMLSAMLASCRTPGGTSRDCLSGRVGLYQLTKEPEDFAGKDIEVGGQVVRIRNAGYQLSNGTDSVDLVFEQPQMRASELVNKAVVLKGVATRHDGRARLRVKQVMRSS